MNWHELSDTQKDAIRSKVANGCGPKIIGRVKINFPMTESCVIHDYNYARRGWPWHKLWADLVFLKDMLLEVPLWFPVSFTFFFWVLLYGWFLFRYSLKRKSYIEIIQARK